MIILLRVLLFHASSPFNLDMFALHGDNSCPDELLCTEEEVFSLLANIDISKSSGPDGISARMLRATAPSITPAIYHTTLQFIHYIRSGTQGLETCIGGANP